MKLTVEQFISLRDIIYDRAGLYFETNKIYLMKKRVQKRLESLNIEDVTEYYNILKYKDRQGLEMQKLLNLLTTNETYFYREDNQLKVFMSHCLNQVMANEEKKRMKKIKIWSAGCSSGEEPYTLAILLRERGLEHMSWNIEIVATDIDTNILEMAQNGIFHIRSTRFVPPAILKKYFQPSGSEYFALEPVIKTMVRFQHLNLMDNLRMRFMRSFDFIFCRNVLIYFNDASRRTVMANFYDSLNAGGYIYLGHSESVTRLSSAFTIERAGGLIVHRKPPSEEV
jgi:chemotaxis protein methyltransferase CheR